MATPIWDKAEAQDVSMYDSSPYKEPLAAFAKLMLQDGRSGHSVEHIARCLPKLTRCCAPFTMLLYYMMIWTHQPKVLIDPRIEHTLPSGQQLQLLINSVLQVCPPTSGAQRPCFELT